MTGRIFTADHHVYDLPPLLSWNVRHTGTVPCDSWSVTAVYQPEMLTVLRMAAGFAAIENGMTQLRGIVDEYTVELDSRGMTVTLSGRGYAARLLDNESRPVTYEQVTLRELIRCHAEPYGISCGAAADLRSTVPYTAGVGISQWKVISEFCRTYGGFLPRFAKTGELLATPEQDSGKRIILDSGSPVLNCRIREDHYGVLTEALVIDKRQNVSYSVKNPEMIAKGGQCRRVIYTPGRSTWDAMRYTGEYQIQQSKKEEQAVTVTLPGSFDAFPGDRVTVRLEKLGLTGTDRENFIASVARYNELAHKGRDEDFAKDPRQLHPIEQGPFYAFCENVRPVGFLMVTVCGLVVDAHQQVIGKDDEPIPGLYATGNCSGERFPIMYTTPVAGVSIGIAYTLGRIVGDYVAKHE